MKRVDRDEFGGKASLSQTATRLLHAARNIVMKKGYSSLSLSAVGEEANEYASLVGYHFGSKAGLVAALQAYNSEKLFSEMQSTLDLPLEGLELVEELSRVEERASAELKELRIFYELLPTLFHDKKLQRNAGHYYHATRSVDAAAFSDVAALKPEEAEQLAVLAQSVMDGMGIQRALDSKGADYAGAYELWRELLTGYLKARALEVPLETPS